MSKSRKATRQTSLNRQYFLVVDVGNTTTHCGVCSAGKINFDFRVPSIASLLLKEIPRTLKRGGFNRRPISGAMVSSVVPKLNATIRTVCRRLHIRATWLNHKTSTGIKLLYERPEEIGPDRIANVVAAKEHYGCPAIVVDIGTAITFDCVSKSGAYIGGIIAPGPKLTRAALAARTGLLPFVDIETPNRLVGKSTAHAIQSGMIFGTRVLIQGLVLRLRREMASQPKVIFTGGQIDLIIHSWSYPKLVDRLLTLEGLRIIYNVVDSRK
jgi:type III pantothenate kinase